MVKEKFAKLINVKTIITFVITGVISYLGLKDKIAPDNMYSLYLIIIGFYFGTQSKKNDVKGGTS